jgi:hypothetical protein
MPYTVGSGDLPCVVRKFADALDCLQGVPVERTTGVCFRVGKIPQKIKNQARVQHTGTTSGLKAKAVRPLIIRRKLWRSKCNYPGSAAAALHICGRRVFP